MRLFIFLLLLSSFPLYASEISLDLGKTSTLFNSFSIPTNRANEINISRDEQVTSYRITGFMDLASGNQLYFLYAPLSVKYNFVSSKNFVFNNSSFSTNTDTTVNYKFNSYRLGYMWKFKSNSFDYWLGVVGKIRDADIEVKQSAKNDNYDNVGFVPLLSFGFDFKILNNLSIYSHTDALGSTQGSAYDSQLEIKLNLSSLSFSFGKRILGGGAENEKVYNFAQFDTYYLKTTYNF